MYKAYHFDINNTIIGTDSTDGDVTLEQSASEALSRSITVDGSWCILGGQTYYNHIKEWHPSDYKSKIYSITKDFAFLQQNFDKLVDSFKHGLFQSFVTFAKTVSDQKGNVIVFRTFGHDIPLVLCMIAQTPTIAHLKFEQVDGQVTPEKIIDAANRGVHLYIKDDYKYWNDNGRKAEFGKLIISDPNIVQYGFDDNDCMYSDGPNGSVGIFKVNTYFAATLSTYFSQLIKLVAN